jgi:hypothetical protein
MDVFLLGFLFVLVLPLAEGVLVALALREVYIRHPLPLGGAIVREWWKSLQSPDLPAEYAEGQETPVESDEIAELVSGETTVIDPGTFAPAAEASPSVGVSHFDRAANIPKDFSAHDTLEAMAVAKSEDIPPELENLIGELAAAKNDHVIEDDLDQEDLQELANALPKQKIDFTQETEENSHVFESISPTAKEVLGDNFDFHTLEQSLKESRESERRAEEHSEPPYPAEMTLDVHQDESGTVQVSSPFMFNVASQVASDFAVPQTVFPTFANDLLHEPSSTVESIVADPAQFCFAEESRPMFAKKTKK